MMETAASSRETDLIVLETLLQMSIQYSLSFTQFFKGKENPWGVELSLHAQRRHTILSEGPDTNPILRTCYVLGILLYTSHVLSHFIIF